MRLPLEKDELMFTPFPIFKPIVLPAFAVVPPMVFEPPPVIKMPSPKLPKAVPAGIVPMKLFWITLSSESRPFKKMPLRSLRTIIFRAVLLPASPISVFAELKIRMPLPSFPKSVVPDEFVSMKQPVILVVTSPN